MIHALIPSNGWYGGLNRRFDKRVAFLHRFGFRRSYVKDIAVYTRISRGTTDLVLSSVIMHEDNRCWRDDLRQLLRR